MDDADYVQDFYIGADDENVEVIEISAGMPEGESEEEEEETEANKYLTGII